jgi:hypothetical protein
LELALRRLVADTTSSGPAREDWNNPPLAKSFGEPKTAFRTIEIRGDVAHAPVGSTFFMEDE